MLHSTYQQILKTQQRPQNHKISVSIPFGFCSPRSVVKFSPVYILIPGSHEGNRSSHRTRTKALVSWALLPVLYLKYSSFLSFCNHFSCLAFFFSFILISWRLITLQYCSGFCHTLTWISHGYTCIPHPDPPSHLPLYPIPLGLPSAPGLSTCLMHPTWAGDLFHPR